MAIVVATEKLPSGWDLNFEIRGISVVDR